MTITIEGVYMTYTPRGTYKYTEEQFIEAVKSSISVASALSKLGLKPRGGNYIVFYRFCKAHNISIEHFKGQGVQKGKSLGYKRPISYYLALDVPYNISTSHLRQRLIKEKLFEAKCSVCHNTEWMEQKIPLELDHINGLTNDCRIENLRLLCPNCHAQTPTYRRSKKKV